MRKIEAQGNSRRWPTVLLTLFVFAVLAGVAGVGFLGSRIQSTTRDIFETKAIHSWKRKPDAPQTKSCFNKHWMPESSKKLRYRQRTS